MVFEGNFDKFSFPPPLPDGLRSFKIILMKISCGNRKYVSLVKYIPIKIIFHIEVGAHFKCIF